MSPHLVAALVHPPVSTFEFACAAEIFGLKRPELTGDWYEFAVCAITPGALLSTGGVDIYVKHGLELLAAADTVVVPSWDQIGPPPEEAVEALRSAFARGARLLSICSGAFLVAATGILDGRRATTHWLYAEEMRRKFPKVDVQTDALYVDEGQVVTAAGSAAGLDMLLHVVRKDHGAAVCNQVARRLVIPPHREGDQAQFVERPIPPVEDSRLARLIEWMRRHSNEKLGVDRLASMAAMSPRTFHRRFKAATGSSPAEWLIRERVEIAKELLEERSISIEQVALRSGFGSPEIMRHHFRRWVGRSPVGYRKSFAAGPDLQPPVVAAPPRPQEPDAVAKQVA